MELQYGADLDSLHIIMFPATAKLEKQSRGRHRESPITTTYQIGFSYDQIGLQQKSAKRRLTWRFGFYKRASWLSEREPFFEQVEHEVDLVCFMRSGKTDVLWNGANMSHTFREISSSGSFEYAWRTRTGESLQIIGSPSRQDGPQYEFFVDGTKFSDLSRMDDLPRRRSQTISGSEERLEDEESLFSCKSSDYDRESNRSNQYEVVPYGSGFRLSLAGLNQGLDVEDELRSNMPSSSLDTLRDAIVSYLPDAEEMVSRAMLNALLDDAVSLSKPEVSHAVDESFQIEAEMLRETFEWINVHPCCTDMDDMKNGILQKHVNAAFTHVQCGRFTVSEALRALLNIACLLKLKLSNPVADNTVILLDLDKNTTASELIDALTTFGEIENTALVQGTGFGVCRFRLDSSVTHVCSAAREKKITISGVTPRVYPLTRCTAIQGNPESIVEAVALSHDKCLGSPLPYFLTASDEDECLQHECDCCGSFPTLRSLMLSAGFPASSSSSSTGDSKLRIQNEFAGKIRKASMATVVSIDAATVATSMDSCSIALCPSLEH